MKLTNNEYRQRKILLNKVKDFWIDGFLRIPIDGNNAINLDLKTCPDAVLHCFEELEILPLELNKSFEELKQSDIYYQIEKGQNLLILGEAGSGKTITLLQLAESLINQAKQDLTKPIPVVFNLSSWGQKQQPIEKWLIQEFQDKYQVSQIWSKLWIEQQQIILLLDGLDEIKENYRNACVRAINKFIADGHLETKIVICSRVKDYEALEEKLLLNNAIYMQPLSDEQLWGFLNNADDSLLGLKTVIEQDREIAEFTKNPLILNMMRWAYHGCSAEQCHKQLRIAKDREFNLFESYIEKNLAPENKETRYPQDKVLHWLNCLAKMMVKESKTLFLIEKLQPTLLLSRSERIDYRISNFLLKDLIVGLSIIISIILISQMLGGLIFILICGVIVGVIAGFSRDITLFEQMSWSWQRAKSKIIREVIIGLRDGMIAGIFIGVHVTFIVLILQYVAYLLNTIFQALSGIIIELPIKEPIDALKGQSLMNGLFYGGICALSILLIVALIRGLNSGLTSPEVKLKTYPNQEIWSFIKKSISIGLIFGLIFGSILGFSVALIGGLDTGLRVGSIFGFNVGLIFGLRNGGTTCIQHFNLRRILYGKGRIPWNYARFLDYVSESLLMKKVGSAYLFSHPMLMEYFAQRKLD